MCLAHGALPTAISAGEKGSSILAKGARATGAQRKKAIVAVARHLAVDLWRIHTGRCSAVQLGLTIEAIEFEGNSFGTWRVSGT